MWTHTTTHTYKVQQFKIRASIVFKDVPLQGRRWLLSCFIHELINVPRIRPPPQPDEPSNSLHLPPRAALAAGQGGQREAAVTLSI